MGGFMRMKKILVILVLVGTVIFSLNNAQPLTAEEEIPKPTVSSDLY